MTDVAAIADLDHAVLRALAFEAAGVAERAAVAAARLAGRGQSDAADQAAVDAMRAGLNAMPIQGRVVIGEGERDEAPMLFIGEEVGQGWTADAPAHTRLGVDIALDPLEGTTLTAKGMPNALAVLALAPRGGLLHAPDTYMEKVAVGPGLPDGVVSLAKSPAENARAVAEAKGVAVSDITVCALDRPRHADLIAELREAGARMALISDGDVAGVINVTQAENPIDLYMGVGGAPEGVLAAAALRCVGGQMQGRLVFRNDDEKARAARVGVTDLERIYDLHELAGGDWIMFAATGVTQGFLVDGVLADDDTTSTHTMLLTSFDEGYRELYTTLPV